LSWLSTIRPERRLALANSTLRISESPYFPRRRLNMCVIVPLCTESRLRFSATLGEEPEVEVTLV
jgi:hypothetical protein